MFEIHVSDNDVTGGSIPVSWCVDKEELKYLSNEGVTEPQVVLIVAPGDDNGYHMKKEIRQVVPMKDMMAYVDFKVSGPNRIWAFISHKSKKDARNAYLSKTNKEFDTWVLKDDGQNFVWGEGTSGLAQPVSVDVPKEAFAPEPSDFEKAWVNHFFSDKCVDQCAFRRRRLFAYLVQPFIMFFNMLVRFLFLTVALLIGAKNVSLKPLLHPLLTSLSDSTEVLFGGSIFIRHLPEDDALPAFTLSYVFRSFWSLFFMPLLLIPLVLMVVFKAWVALLAVAAALVIVPLILLLIGFLEAGGLHNLVSLFNWDKKSTKKSDFWYLHEEEMDLLVCNGQKKPLSMSELPSNKRTLRLRFRDLKSKVCRPFSA